MSNASYPDFEVWDGSVAPGGFVCRECEGPVESEPCYDHNPIARAELEIDRLRRERDFETENAEGFRTCHREALAENDRLTRERDYLAGRRRALEDLGADAQERAAKAEVEVEQLRTWQREVCDRFGYDSDQPGAAEEVLTSLPFWLGEEAARRDAMAHVKALCDAEDERVAEANARFAAKGIADKTGRPLTITGILPSLEVRHALFGPDSIEPPCPKHPYHRAEDCIPCAVGA